MEASHWGRGHALHIVHAKYTSVAWTAEATDFSVEQIACSPSSLLSLQTFIITGLRAREEVQVGVKTT